MSTDPSATALGPLVGTWTLDPATTTVAFTTKAVWLLPVRATARATRGSGSVGEDGLVRGTVEFDAASIDTGNAKRGDQHPAGQDFFAGDRYLDLRHGRGVAPGPPGRDRLTSSTPP